MGLIRTEFFRVVAAELLASCRPAGSYESFEELCCLLPQCANYLMSYPHTQGYILEEFSTFSIELLILTSKSPFRYLQFSLSDT